MLSGIVYGLITAWILSWFQIDKIFVHIVQPFIQHITITVDHYYFVFGCIGCIEGAISDIINSEVVT